MSYDVSLNNSEGSLVEVKTFSEGGTYLVGGNNLAELDITYNYGKIIREYLNPEGLMWLDGRKASEVLPALINAVDQLGTDTDQDYWEATPGNTGKALAILAEWAKDNPEGIFEVT